MHVVPYHYSGLQLVLFAQCISTEISKMSYFVVPLPSPFFMILWEC